MLQDTPIPCLSSFKRLLGYRLHIWFVMLSEAKTIENVNILLQHDIHAKQWCKHFYSLTLLSSVRLSVSDFRLLSTMASTYNTERKLKFLNSFGFFIPKALRLWLLNDIFVTIANIYKTETLFFLSLLRLTMDILLHFF